MRIWFDSDGKGASGKRYFAVVEEIMIDKDGKPVYVPSQKSATTVVEPVVEPVENEPEMVVEKAPEVVVAPETVAEPNDDALMNIMNDMSSKMDVIIEYLDKNNITVPGVNERVESGEEIVETTETTNETNTTEINNFDEVAAAEDVVSNDTTVIPVVIPVTPEVPVDVAPVETPVDVVAPKAPARRSPYFAEKMRDADELLQDRYDELKNYALRFRKLKSRISKKFDSINQGRLQFVKLSIAGKTLKLYLNMDASTTEPKFHCKDVSDKKTYVTVPTLLRIKSGRAVKYAKILIDQCADNHGLLERRKPFEVDAMALIDEALAGKEEPVVNADENATENSEN